MTAHTADTLSLDYLIELGDTGHGRRRNLILAPRGLRWCTLCRRPVELALFPVRGRTGELRSRCRPCLAAEQRVKVAAARRGRELPEIEAPMHPPHARPVRDPIPWRAPAAPLACGCGPVAHCDDAADMLRAANGLTARAMAAPWSEAAGLTARWRLVWQQYVQHRGDMCPPWDRDLWRVDPPTPIEPVASVPNGCVVRYCQACGAAIDGDGLKPNEYRARVYCSVGCVNRTNAARASAARDTGQGVA